MTTIEFGPNRVKYNIYHVEEILKAGYVYNPSYGHIFGFCVPCNRYNYLSGYTPVNDNVTGRRISVCEECNHAAINSNQDYLDFYFNFICKIVNEVFEP